jgi:hypothetical protein
VVNALALEAALKRVERATLECRNSNQKAEAAVLAMGAWSQMKACLVDLRERVGPTLQEKIDEALKFANGEAAP